MDKVSEFLFLYDSQTSLNIEQIEDQLTSIASQSEAKGVVFDKETRSIQIKNKYYSCKLKYSFVDYLSLQENDCLNKYEGLLLFWQLTDASNISVISK